jgi:putative membrane protein
MRWYTERQAANRLLHPQLNYVSAPQGKGEEYADMGRNLYSQFDTTELILRDQLAIDRTLLANERTLMSYLRSGVALFIAGISIIHFSQEAWFAAMGFLCLPCALVTVLIGVVRFRKMDKDISVVRMELSRNSTMEHSAAGQETL